MEKFQVWSAKIDGKGKDLICEFDNVEEAYQLQVKIYRNMCQYASGGGERFQKMLDLNYEFVLDLASKLEKGSPPSKVENTDDGYGGLITGLSYLKK